ncbi:uncharacterized protein LOC131656067 [Vicia villosa]|uniref:uncharacterized protein LOC131656067 n=1 Tax=Vicia villosa TaxID=3911 RepID=UPI00273C7CE4|nr:uncharacterized protein LOC131656067 [Vicia villosa]
MAPRFPIVRDQKRKTSDSSSSVPNFDSDRFRSKKCEEYYVTTRKRGMLLRVKPNWRRLRVQNQMPDTDMQKWDSILHEMEVLRRKCQIGMENDQRIEDLLRNLWQALNLNVIPMRKRTAEDVDEFVNWKPFQGHPIGSQEDDTEEEYESEGSQEDDDSEEEGESEEYETKKAVIFHNREALLRLGQVYTESRQRLKDISRQMYEGLRRNDPPITDMKDEEIAWMVKWMETFYKTFFNT